MQKVLWGILIFVILVFGFGLFKHNFDFSEYLYFLSNTSTENFTKNFEISKPNTWLSFLYKVQEDEKIDELDKQLEELNNIADLGEEDIFTGDLNNSGNVIGSGGISGNSILSGNITGNKLTGDFVATGNLNITGVSQDLTGNQISGTVPKTGDSLESGLQNSGELKTPDKTGKKSKDDVFSGFGEFFETLDESDFQDNKLDTGEKNQEKTPNFTNSGNKTGNENISTNKPDDEKLKNNSKDRDITPIGDDKKNLQKASKTGKLSPLLKKRLDQYKEFKKTIK